VTNFYAPQVKSAINYFLTRTGVTIVYKRLRNKGEWSPTGNVDIWWEWISPTAVVYDASIKDIEESGGRLIVGDKAFVLLNSVFTDRSGLSFLKFNSGSTEFTVGETVTGAVGEATGVVVSWYETSGDWTTNNAVGGLYVSGITGTFEAEALNGSIGGNDMATCLGANETAPTDYAVPEAGDEIVYLGKTYNVEMEAGESPIIREDVTRSTSTIYARAKNV